MAIYLPVAFQSDDGLHCKYIPLDPVIFEEQINPVKFVKSSRQRNERAKKYGITYDTRAECDESLSDCIASFTEPYYSIHLVSAKLWWRER